MQQVRKLLIGSAMAVVCAMAGFAANAADSNVAGTWEVTVASTQPDRPPNVSTLTLTQKGSDLTGTLKGRRGDQPITGSVKGKDVKLESKLEFQGQSMTITYTGTVDGATIKGKVSRGQLGDADFTAKKQ